MSTYARTRIRRAIWTTVAVAMVAATTAMVALPEPSRAAQPVPGHTKLPPDVARTNVARIANGEIFDLEYIGNKIYVAGTFTAIRNNAGANTTSYNQRWLAAFDIGTGLVDTAFRPTFDTGGVTEIEASPDGTRLYAVGRFNAVNGVTRRKVVALNPTNGSVITAFQANANAAATSIEATNTRVYIGGQFTTIRNTARVGLAAVNASDGTLVTGFVNNLSGGIGVNGLLTVQALVLSPDDSKLLVVHTGRQIAGQDRYGVGLINTTNNQLLPWRTRLWDDNLAFVGGVQRIYAGAIAPNGQYFVVSSGSGGDRPPINDTAIAFPIDGGDNMQPLWVSRLFDSVYSIAISENAVYVGGHFNYMESQTAQDPWPGLTTTGYGRGQGLAGYGLGDNIVIRDHIGALDPTNGKELPWDPGSDSFEGNKAMLVHPRGVIAGGDATTQGGFALGRIAVYDFNSVPAPGQNETTILNPIKGRVVESDVPFTIDGTATATSGVNRVQLEIQDRDSLRYLADDLVTWGTAWNGINATLGGPGATSTNWNQTITVSGNRRLRVYARTFAVNGTNDGTKALHNFETFGLEDDTPTTGISTPNTTVVPTLTFLTTGTANDDLGINSITYTIRDAQTRYLQDDGTASTNFNSFRGDPDVIGATAATWQWEWTLPYEGEWTMQATAVDTTGQADLRSADRTWIVSSTAIAPSVAIDAPAAMLPPTPIAALNMAPGAPLTFSGSATDDEGLDYVEILLRNTTTRENLASDGTWGVDALSDWHRITGPNSLPGTSASWSYTTPFNLRPGTYTLSVRAADDLGLTTSTAFRGNLTINVQVPGDAFPDGTLDVTGTILNTPALHLDLTGRATDDFGVAAVRVTIRESDSSRYLQPNGTLASNFALLDAVVAVPGSTNTAWSISRDLPAVGDYAITAYAFDTSDQQDPSTTGATARYLVYPGDTAPTVTEALLAPTEGTAFSDSRILVSGRVEDNLQIARAEIAIRNSAGQYMSTAGAFTSTTEIWIRAFLNSPGSPGSNFSYTSPIIPAGGYTVLVRGMDSNDLVTPVPSIRNVTVAGRTGNLAPVANFTYSCTANICNFDGRSSTDENAPTLTYSWTFGTATASGPVPTRTFTAPGVVTVLLTVRDEFGLSNTTSQTVTITEPATNLPPTAALNPPSCVARACNFSAVGSVDPNLGDTLSYLWNWGDGTPTVTTQTASKTYLADGVYNVVLTVTDGWGRATTVTHVLTIAEPLTNLPPNPVISVPSCAARTCNLSALSSTDPNGDPITYSWNFGDGSPVSTLAVPTKTFAADGTYTVTLTATDAWGDVASTTYALTLVEPVTNVAPTPVISSPVCVARTCTFKGDTSTDPNGDTMTYSWNFGDGGALSTTMNTTKTYAADGSYTVTLTVTDGWGDAASTTTVVNVAKPVTNVAPTAVINAPTCTARTCTFNAVGSVDANGDAFTYSWNFGDGGALSTATTPTKTYAADNTYTVTLTLTDAWGDAASVTRTVVIAKPPTNVAPVPVIPAPSCVARVCTFTALSSIDPEGDAMTYLWNFGDGGATSTLATPAKAYAADGTYTVTLTATDAWGQAASVTRVVTITEPVTNVAPTPVIGTPSCTNLWCVFSAAATTDANGDPITYLWNFGDGGATSTLQVPGKLYAAAGTYTVTLTATDAWGDAASTTITVTVPNP